MQPPSSTQGGSNPASSSFQFGGSGVPASTPASSFSFLPPSSAPAPAPASTTSAPSPFSFGGLGGSGGGSTAGAKVTATSTGGASTSAPAPSPFAFGGFGGSGGSGSAPSSGTSTSAQGATSSTPALVSFSFGGEGGRNDRAPSTTRNVASAALVPRTEATTPGGALAATSQVEKPADREAEADKSRLPALHASLHQAFKEEEAGRRFAIEFQGTSLAQIHAELMLCLEEDLARHEREQAEIARMEAEVEDARRSAREGEEMVREVSSAWEAVWREVMRVEGKQAAVEAELRELEAMIEEKGDRWRQRAIQQGGEGRLFRDQGGMEERVAMHQLAVRVDDRLRRVLTRIRELSNQVGGALEKRLSDESPVANMVRIMNVHQHALEWVTRTAESLERDGEEVEWRVKTTAKLPRMQENGSDGRY